MHGDDYVSVGMPKQFKWMDEQLMKKYQIKTQVFGPEEGQVKELKISNGIVTWNGSKGLTYEADPRHVEIVVEQLRLNEAKPVATPGTREEGTTQQDSQEQLGDEEASKYRALVARCNYLSPDRPDISYTVKELARHMSNPTKGNWAQFKRFGRYLKGKPRLQQGSEWQAIHSVLRTYSDAAWAGCKDTRKSTTGGCIINGRHTLKGWSKTQSLVALSSGESELYATLKTAAETLGMLSLMKHVGWQVTGEIWGDASAALGITNRRGLGKTRHIDIGLLWIQQIAAEKRLKFHKVLGMNNPADLYTKHLDVAITEKHTKIMAYECTEGRASEAPKLHMIQSGDDDLCQCVRELCHALSINKSAARSQKACTVECGHVNVLERLTGSRRQVFQGINWQVQGSTGSNAAQPSQPWGSILTFQPSVVVSWVPGLRHGVTMHPRGRHSREGMILPSPWRSQHRPVNSSHNINLHNHNTTTTIWSWKKSQNCKEMWTRKACIGWIVERKSWREGSSMNLSELGQFAFKHSHVRCMYITANRTRRP